MSEEMKTPTANGKLSTIFLVVLGLHVAVIVAFIAYNLLKGNTEAAPEVAETEQVEEIMPTIEKAELPQHEPALETDQNPVAESGAPVEAGKAAETEMFMPSSSDPIYSTANNTTIKPRNLEPVMEAVKPVAEVVSQQVKPMVNSTLVSYSVKKGDSLARIARNHGVSVQELRDANGISGDMIKIGQTLNIPSSGMAPAAASVVSKAVVNQAVSAVTTASTAVVAPKTSLSDYTVMSGDTLWKIAKTFNTQPSQIAKINNITDPSKLKIGSTIKVPTSSSQEASAPKAQPVRTDLQNTDVAMVPQSQR
jgi:LysM repeat protein